MKGETSEPHTTYMDRRISIRSPMKGETTDKVINNIIKQISIRSPMKGETKQLVTNMELNKISIRSPMKGETLQAHNLERHSSDFNPLAHERRDREFDVSVSYAKHFNPLAHERRDVLPVLACFKYYFLFQSARP